MALAAVLVLVLAPVSFAAYGWLNDGGSRPTPPTPTPTPSRAERGALSAGLLLDLERALSRHDATQARRLSAPRAGSPARIGETLVRTTRRLRMDRLDLRFLDDRDATVAQRRQYGADAWVADAGVRFRFSGVDRRSTTTEAAFVMTLDPRAGGRAALADVTAARPRRCPLWLLEPLRVRREQRVLVAAARASAAATLEKQAGRALQVVNRTLPGWHGPLVVEAPDRTGDFEAATGMSASDARAIAAVTATTGGSGLPGTPVHVYVNPSVYDPLGPKGQQIVLSHEATHVAVGGATTKLPMWLSEGFADYVALADSRLPLRVLASQILALVRDHGAPRSLPAAGDFEGSNPDIGAAYESAWLAVRLIAEEHGRRALVRFYRVAERDGDPAAAFSQVLGTTEHRFTALWRRELVRLAR